MGGDVHSQVQGPWDHPAAAMWLADLLSGVEAGSRIVDTLRLDPAEYAEEIRAAAALIVVLAQAGQREPRGLDAAARIALQRLRELGRRGLAHRVGGESVLAAELARLEDLVERSATSQASR